MRCSAIKVTPASKENIQMFAQRRVDRAKKKEYVVLKHISGWKDAEPTFNKCSKERLVREKGKLKIYIYIYLYLYKYLLFI